METSDYHKQLEEIYESNINKLIQFKQLLDSLENIELCMKNKINANIKYNELLLNNLETTNELTKKIYKNLKN